MTKEARIRSGEKIVSSVSGAGKIGQLHAKEYFLTPYTKLNSKWIKDLNVRPDTIKLLEENIGKTLFDVNHSRILYDPPPRVMEMKAKINKMGPNYTEKLMHSQRNYKQGEKTAFRMGENNSK